MTAAPAPAVTLGGWSLPQQRILVRAGLMPTLADHRFHGERRLTVAQLRHALDGLAKAYGMDRVPLPGRGTVSVAAFDRLMVEQLGLADVAVHVQRQARRAGLSPPARFGTEVVARQLGLRHSFASIDDRLELFPTDAITRAEAAWSLAIALRMPDAQIAFVADQLLGLRLPSYDADQRRILRLAVSKIGMPYIWGGEYDTAISSGDPQSHGGYDCSGFVWRVFKLSGSPWGHLIQGRTAAQQAGEIPRSRRIRLGAVRGADLLFFGTASFSSTATEANVTHEGIALTKDWMIQSSGQGVYLGSLREDWRRREFAWARRVL